MSLKYKVDGAFYEKAETGGNKKRRVERLTAFVKVAPFSRSTSRRVMAMGSFLFKREKKASAIKRHTQNTSSARYIPGRCHTLFTRPQKERETTTHYTRKQQLFFFRYHRLTIPPRTQS